MTVVDELQRTLAAEHAAVYVYGVLGGRAADLPDERLRAALAAAYDAHVTRRDELRRTISVLGADPVAAEPAYRLPRGLTTATQVRAQALRTERACVEQYGALVAATGPGPTRTWAVTALDEAAQTELDLGGRPQALPGVTIPA
jgi:hypothetical protein